MENKNTQHRYSIPVDLTGSPSTQSEIDGLFKTLQSKFRSNINFVLVNLTLAVGVAIRTISLNYDPELELLEINLFTGLFFGLFIGFMVDGNAKRKFKVALIGSIFCASASIFSSMLMTLIVGQLTSWITSITILASALGGMWMLTYYDEVLKGIDSIKSVNRSEFLFIKNASSQYEALDVYTQQIKAMDRMPMVAEYWAFEDWVRQQSNQL